MIAAACLGAVLAVSLTMHSAAASTRHVIPNTDLTAVRSSAKLNISYQTYQRCSWGGGCAGTVIQDPGGVASDATYMFCVPIPSTSSPCSYSNFLDIYFTHVGTLAGKPIDAVIHFNNVYYTERRSTTGLSYLHPSGMTAVAVLKDDGSCWIARATSLNPDNYGYNAGKTFDISVKFTWSDTGQPVNLPFYQLVYDIDTYNIDGYSEGWQGISGFSPDMYTYSTCALSIGDLSACAATFRGPDYDGDDSILYGGFFVPTVSSEVRMVFTECSSESELAFYSPYTQLRAPTKQIITP